ncbi:hypothetical protein [Nocardia blacklockiae]|uniref:hypothetical protein n=1 Tax=Nocardia blacklockiae TaxID=480036 RepID=UPI001894621F|nr:hypothetical protein [Nocardia blacklockiae]MBF6175568.1 hypothetical protein [Nocardia blacklockiae]
MSESGCAAAVSDGAEALAAAENSDAAPPGPTDVSDTDDILGVPETSDARVLPDPTDVSDTTEALGVPETSDTAALPDSAEDSTTAESAGVTELFDAAELPEASGIDRTRGADGLSHFAGVSHLAAEPAFPKTFGCVTDARAGGPLVCASAAAMTAFNSSTVMAARAMSCSSVDTSARNVSASDCEGWLTGLSCSFRRHRTERTRPRPLGGENNCPTPRPLGYHQQRGNTRNPPAPFSPDRGTARPSRTW